MHLVKKYVQAERGRVPEAAQAINDLPSRQHRLRDQQYAQVRSGDRAQPEQPGSFRPVVTRVSKGPGAYGLTAPDYRPPWQSNTEEGLKWSAAGGRSPT